MLESVIMEINVQSDIAKAMRRLQSIAEAKQFRFSVAKALTTTAAQVQAEVKRNMPSRFTLRRDWIVKGIRMKPASKTRLEASVFSTDKFMGLQEIGGDKSPLRNFLAIPTSMVKRTPRDLVKRGDRPAALGDRASVVEVNGNKYLALKKPRKAANGQRLRLLYLLVPRANIKERLGLRKDGVKVARARFVENLRTALADALRTAK